jgi:hypothetical protein
MDLRLSAGVWMTVGGRGLVTMARSIEARSLGTGLAAIACSATEAIDTWCSGREVLVRTRFESFLGSELVLLMGSDCESLPGSESRTGSELVSLLGLDACSASKDDDEWAGGQRLSLLEGTQTSCGVVPTCRHVPEGTVPCHLYGRQLHDQWHPCTLLGPMKNVIF